MQTSPVILKMALVHISSLMRKFREEKTRLTQDDVAKRMGVSRAYIHQLESGKINYSFEVFFRYCIAVGAKPTIELYAVLF
jgi:transcriptional regulator with XRE-family HTH domain